MRLVRLVQAMLVVWVAAAGVGLYAQSGKVPAFDVVSVKPNNSGSGVGKLMMRDDGLAMENLTLMSLVAFAYDMKGSNLSGGPDWGSSARFDVKTKVAEADLAEAKKSDELSRRMLQTALVERFGLQVHHETKIMSVYELVVAKGGAKMKPATPGDTYANGMKGADGVGRAGMIRVFKGELIGQGVAMSKFTEQLYFAVQRKVIDKTGLTGTYDITLKWTPEAPGAIGDADSGTTPGIFTAMQEQLGLKLQAAKAPLDTLVIDHAEKPAEN